MMYEIRLTYCQHWKPTGECSVCESEALAAIEAHRAWSVRKAVLEEAAEVAAIWKKTAAVEEHSSDTRMARIMASIICDTAVRIEAAILKLIGPEPTDG